MIKDRRVDVGYCKVWTDDLGTVSIQYDESPQVIFPEDVALDMIQALSTWYMMGRTQEVVIRDE
jgi:hypothetical protein